MQKQTENIVNNNVNKTNELLASNDLTNKLSKLSKALLVVITNYLTTDECDKVLDKAFSDYSNHKKTLLNDVKSIVYDTFKNHGMSAYNSDHTGLTGDPTTFRLGNLTKALINALYKLDSDLFSERFDYVCGVWCIHHNTGVLVSVIPTTIDESADEVVGDC